MERYLELGNEHSLRGDAGCFSPFAHNVYIDMLVCQVLVSELIHSELLIRIENELGLLSLPGIVDSISS